jgi:hypothetical protein
MLLRRIRQHVANENWFAVFVDFVIVVVGVYVGIEVSNWNETRQEEARAQEYLERLRADLAHDLEASTSRRVFWAQVIEYGEAAIGHSESGQLHDGSPRQTVLAYYQASQADPWAAVSTTYDEMKAAGELRLIRHAALRAGLADYYNLVVNLQAQHLFQVLPAYREYVRGVMPFAVQGFVWANCHENTDGAQVLRDCDLPLTDAESERLLAQLSADPQIVRGLRFWIANMTVARNVLARNDGRIRQLLEQLDELLEAS